jgi:hypothetical protein
MTTLKRDTIPTVQNHIPPNVVPFDVVSSTVMESADPAIWLAPVYEADQSKKLVLPVLKYLSLRRKVVRELRTDMRHGAYSHSIVPGGFDVTS